MFGRLEGGGGGAGVVSTCLTTCDHNASVLKCSTVDTHLLCWFFDGCRPHTPAYVHTYVHAMKHQEIDNNTVRT